MRVWKPTLTLPMSCRGGEECQPRRRRVVHGVHAAGAGQPLPDGGLGQQRLEAGTNIGQVVLQQVDAFRPLLPVGLRLGPELAGVVRRVFQRWSCLLLLGRTCHTRVARTLAPISGPVNTGGSDRPVAEVAS